MYAQGMYYHKEWDIDNWMAHHRQCRAVIYGLVYYEKLLGQIKKISVFRVTGLKILGRVDMHIF